MRFFQKSFLVYVKLHHIFFSPWVNYAFMVFLGGGFLVDLFLPRCCFPLWLLWPFAMVAVCYELL
jgi:hypothetical protein